MRYRSTLVQTQNSSGINCLKYFYCKIKCEDRKSMQYTHKTQEIIIRQTYIGQEVQSCQHLQKLPPCVPSQLPLFLFPHEEASHLDFSFFGCSESLLWFVGFLYLWHKGFSLSTDFSCCRPLILENADSVVEVQTSLDELSCPTACGILVPQPGIKPEIPALEGRFLTTGPPGKFQDSTS